MSNPTCPVCSKPMLLNPGGKAGDPVYLCTVDDAAHRAAAAARKAEREALLRAAREAPPPPDPALLEAIAAWERAEPANPNDLLPEADAEHRDGRP